MEIEAHQVHSDAFGGPDDYRVDMSCALLFQMLQPPLPQAQKQNKKDDEHECGSQRWLGNDFLGDITSDIGQSVKASSIEVGELLVIEAQ